MSNASFQMNGVEVFSENAQTVTVKNINVAANDTTTPSMCKAWVNFDGTFTMTLNSSYGPNVGNVNPIRAAYNVDYIIDRGTGQYEIHFENAMPDANYVISGMVSNTQDDWQSVSTYANRGPTGIFQNGTTQPSSESCRVQTRYGSNSTSDGNDLDFSQVTVAFFR